MDDVGRILDLIPMFAGRPRRVSALEGGLTNRNYRITTADGAFVLRRSPPPEADLLAIDRDREHQNSRSAAEAGVGAEVVAYLPAEQVMVVRWIPGRTFTDASFAEPGTISRVADACRQLHHGPRFVGDFDMFELQLRYLDVIQDKGFRLPARYLDFRPQVEQIRRALAVRAEATVPCNNDLLAGNFIDDGERVRIIDYEYAGNNDPCFELGNIWSECHLSLDQLRELLDGYYGRPLRNKLARAQLLGLMSKYGWMLWASIQHSTSPLDFDFWSWGLEKYDAAVAMFEHPGFDRLLEEFSVPTDPPTNVPDRARVVVIGGGIIGASVAYHLTVLGWTDLVLLEQGQLSGGTTWHAAGLVGQLRANESGTRLVQYSAGLYERLEADTGLATGFKRCGGVTVARTADRMMQLRRTAATAEAFGLECELISPERARELYPILGIDDLLGALWLPGDGTANPTDVTASLARGARNRGARVIERTRVIGVDQRDGAVTGVRTDRGDIEAEIVVNCAGQWAKAVGALGGVNVPLHSAEHFYVVTDQIDGVHRDLPILRDPDGYTYFKEEVGGLVVGGFEPQAKPWVAPDAIPHPFVFQLLDEDWDHFSILMDSALLRIPALGHTGIKKFYNGPESFTPDNQFVLGEAPELKNFFVAAGFNSVGIASAGGAGRALAEWIAEGEPTSDLSAVDIRRFAPFHGNNQWLHDRVSEILGLHYEVPWPNRELLSARPFRRSPAYHLLAAAGASFGSKMGWERANYFDRATPVEPGSAPGHPAYTWAIPDWQQWSNAEQRATRTRVAIFDQTSFGKLSVTGRDAETLLQWLCTADVAVEPGRVVYTGMLNSRGGYEADVTVTRIAAAEYLLVTGSTSIERDRDWIRKHTGPNAHVSVTDVSSAYAVYGVMGPRSRELLQTLTRADLSDEAFPFATSRLIDLGHATVRATRITYVGELGWELYVPTEFAVGVYETITRAGRDFGLVDAGYYAINSLRLEKGYRAFGAELTPDHNPVEAGLLFACKLGTDVDFLGREAVARARADGPRRRAVSFVLTDQTVMMWGGELVLRDGVAVGQVTSAAWADSTGSAVALAYVSRRDGGPVTTEFLADGAYEINVGGTRCAATPHRRAPFDPTGARIRS